MKARSGVRRGGLWGTMAAACGLIVVLGSGALAGCVGARELTVTPSVSNDPEPVRASRSSVEFERVAQRAVALVLLDEQDDVSVLLSLHDQLESGVHDQEVSERWRPSIERALFRATWLQVNGSALRALRAAMRDAHPNKSGAGVKNVDSAKCLAAFEAFRQKSGPVLDELVRIEAVGTFPLAYFKRICSQASMVEKRRRRLKNRGRRQQAPQHSLARASPR